MAKDSPIRNEICECPTHGKGQELTNYRRNRDRRVPEEKELIDARHDNNPDNAQEPCSDGGDGHVWVVRVRDG
jgi:hypothetical protein